MSAESCALGRGRALLFLVKILVLVVCDMFLEKQYLYLTELGANTSSRKQRKAVCELYLLLKQGVAGFPRGICWFPEEENRDPNGYSYYSISIFISTIIGVRFRSA